MILVALLVAVLSVSINASLAKVQAEEALVARNETQELWFDQTINHFAADQNATFQQRYYEVNEFWSNFTGPILLNIGGKGALEHAPAGFTHTIAAKFEHRFYGKSISNNNLSTENYQFLTVQQALADLKHFKDTYQSLLGTEDADQWIAIGGSYPGALSAWFRVAI
ncbi:hypothetical protein CCR75_002475 [Bremia lactucae]|uniref:Uncharacterized protein n=1 Tax=Bremia lactucae TaxID=4779 RepID=A0A976FD83_BRELC|nr:hypothetical protein CCR75_002475 [Bremia lactucae]